MKRNFIITGAAGHLGGVIIKKLSRLGCRVRGLILPGEKGVAYNNVEYVTGDVTAPETLDPLFEGLDAPETVLIHTAGIITIQEQVSPALRRVNVDGTKNIIAKCWQYGISRLVYVSSVHAIPGSDKGGDIRETDVFNSEQVEGAYAKTKAIATKAVLNAGKEGLDVVVVHPSGIIGPYDNGSNHIVQLFKMYIKRKLPAIVRGGYDFVDVRDVAEGVIAAAEKGRSGECYILSNRYFSMQEMGEYMRKATGRKLRLPCLSLRFVSSFAPMFEFFGRISLKRPVFTKYSLKTLGFKGRFSHDKATRELGYHPRDMKDTVADTMRYLKTAGASR